MEGTSELWVSLTSLSLVHLSLKTLEQSPHLLFPESHEKLLIFLHRKRVITQM